MFYRLSATLVALFSLAAFVAAIPTDMVHNIKRGATKSACGSEPSFEEVNRMENAFNSILAGNSGIASSAGSSTIQVVFNVIYASTDYSGGYVLYVAWPILSSGFSSFQSLVSEIPRSKIRSMS